jgi:Family of unknown function (DUF6535)
VLLAVTVLDLKPNPQEKSAFYLENIYQLLADGNISLPSTPVTRVESPPFSVPHHLILVNSLWFLSLTISLTCAMLATMLQQWARRYLRIIQRPRHSPHDGARICAFFARGVKKLRFQMVAEAIPALIHISLFLFFIGLTIYLFNTNPAVFGPVVWWVGASALLYLVITIMPILRVDSPYYSPLSPLFFRLYAGLLYSIRFSKNLRDLATAYSLGFSKGIEKMAGEEITKKKKKSKVDKFILKWTFDAHSFAADDQLDKFFKYIYGFYSSNIVQDPLHSLAALDSRKFSSALVAFLNRTLSSGLPSVTDLDKVQRFIMCVRIADATQTTPLRDLFSVAADHSLLWTVEIGRTLRSPSRPDEIGLCAQTIIAVIIASAEGGDDWIELAADQLGKSENAIRRYLAQGNDSVLLANWIHMARLISTSSSGINRHMAREAAECILEPSSNFDIQNTLPELQHDFCSLWNEIVPKAQRSGSGSVPHFIVFMLRSLYMDLHQGTDDTPAVAFNRFDVLSYPLCFNTRHCAQEIPTSFPLSPWLPTHTGSQPPDLSSPGDVPDVPRLSPSPISPEHDLSPAPSEQVTGTSTNPQDNEPTIDTHIVVPDSPSSTAVLSGPINQLTGDPGNHLQAESSVSGSPPGPASSSLSPIVASSPIQSQAAPLSVPGATSTATTTLRIGEDAQVRDTSSPLELPGHPQQSEPSTAHTATTVSGREDRESPESPA